MSYSTMDIATRVCPEGHPTVSAGDNSCRQCGQKTSPIRIVTKLLRLEVVIMGYDPKLDNVAHIRYKETGERDKVMQEDLMALDTYSDRLLSFLFSNGVITGK